MPHRIIRRSHIFCRSRDESFSVIEKINAASGTFCGIKTDNGKFYIINLKFATMGQIKTPNHVIFEWEKKSESNGLESLLSDHKLWLWWNWKYVGLYKTISPIHFYSLEQSRFWKVFSQPSSQLLIDGVRCSLLAWLWITSNASEENVWNIIPCLIEEESSLSYPTTSTFNFNFYKMVFLILTIKEKENPRLPSLSAKHA